MTDGPTITDWITALSGTLVAVCTVVMATRPYKKTPPLKAVSPISA